MKEYEFNNPYFDKLVGLPVEHKEHLKDWDNYLKQKVEKAGGGKESVEIQKTEHDIKILDFVIKNVRELLSEYGRKKIIEIPENNIHLLKIGGTEELTNGKLVHGGHSFNMNSVIIDRVESDTQFAVMAFHELLHAMCFKAAQIVNNESGEPNIKPYRVGISCADRKGKKVFLGNLEEAIIQHLTKQFFESLTVEKQKTGELPFDSLKDKEKVVFSRGEELASLYKLIDDLFEKNKEAYNDKNEILKLFINAQVNGELLPIARLIEKTYGPGSFREISEKFRSDFE